MSSCWGVYDQGCDGSSNDVFLCSATLITAASDLGISSLGSCVFEKTVCADTDNGAVDWQGRSCDDGGDDGMDFGMPMGYDDMDVGIPFCEDYNSDDDDFTRTDMCCACSGGVDV
jgi:hypothetical protein